MMIRFIKQRGNRCLIIKDLDNIQYQFKSLNSKAFAFKINQLLRNPRVALQGKGIVVKKTRERDGWAMMGIGLVLLTTGILMIIISFIFIIIVVLLFIFAAVFIPYGAKYLNEAKYAEK